MVIMTNKQFEKRLEEERKKVSETYYQEERLESMRERIFRLERQVANLKGEDENHECGMDYMSTPHIR